MDHDGGDLGGGFDEEVMGNKPRALPDDLPKSLNDRRSVPVFAQETEMYDAWQGMNTLEPYLPHRC